MMIGTSQVAIAGFALVAHPGLAQAPLISLDAGQMASLTKLSDFLIPRTDTPGAVDAGCPAFVAGRIVQLPCEKRTAVEAGLNHIGRLLAHAADWASLHEAAAREDSSVMATLSQLRDWILFGYYTSEPGATQELLYEPVPGRYDPDVPVTAETRLYSSDPFTQFALVAGGKK